MAERRPMVGWCSAAGAMERQKNADAIGDLRLAPVFRHDLALARPVTLASLAAAEYTLIA